ncbi:MAG: DUF4411 family protein [candidate division WOR-3 bacterium]|nr:DUF4411 family protein [candidate division WOR-3 bacterium]
MRQESLKLDSRPPGHVIDTSALIDLHQVVYAPDVFRTLWTNLAELVDRGVLLAPREVYNEIVRGNDALVTWAKQHKRMFCDPDGEQQSLVRDILRRFPRLVDSTKLTPAADPFVIALAEAGMHTVVCSEKSGMPGRPRIPGVCKARNVRCVDSLGMFRDLKWSF